MRILFYSSVFPQPDDPTRGTFSGNLCRHLAHENEVRVVSPWEWHRHIRTDHRQVHLISDLFRSVGIEVEYPAFVYPPRILAKMRSDFMWYSARAALQRASSPRPDFVLSYWGHPDGAAALRAARKLGVPMGLILGGSDVLLLDRMPARSRFVEVYRSADLLLPVSRDLGRRLVDLGVDPDRIRVVYQGVDRDRFCVGSREEASARLGIDPRQPHFLWVGRMVPVKALDVLLAACSEFRATGVGEFRLSLVGTGPLRRELERRVGQLGLDGQVHFVGSATHETLPDWYRSADALVLPSHSEGIPNVLREALACGCPFIASRVGGIPELDDPACRLVAPGSVPELVDAMRSILEQKVVKLSLSRRANTGDWSESASEVARALREIRKTANTQAVREDSTTNRTLKGEFPACR